MNTTIIRTALAGAMFIAVLCANAQQIVGTYPCRMMNKAYEVKATNEGDAWISGPSMDDRQQECGFIVKNKVLPVFRESLLAVRDKYRDWTMVAKGQEVQDMLKEMPVNVPKVTYFFTYGEVQFAFNKLPTAYFSISEGRYEVMLVSGVLTASSNQYMKTNGVMLAFSDEGEISALYDILAPGHIQEELQRLKETKDLFK